MSNERYLSFWKIREVSGQWEDTIIHLISDKYYITFTKEVFK